MRRARPAARWLLVAWATPLVLLGACASGADAGPGTATSTARVERASSTTTATTPTLAPRSFTVTGDRAGFAHGFQLVRRETPAEVDGDLDLMAGTGARWLRAGISWGSIETSPGVDDWAGTDRVVLGAIQRGMSVVAVVSSAPGWAKHAGCHTDECAPRDPADYAAFLRTVVARYEPAGVHHWEIWNEPNSAAFWGPAADPVEYTRLLQAAYTTIHGLDPHAVVMSGGLSPAGDVGGNLSPLTFLRRVYELGGGRSLDAVAHHPYNFPASPTAAGPTNAFLQTLRLHDLMVEFGDGAKKIWGTEVGAPTRGPSAVSEADQARWLDDYYDAWNGWAFTGPLLWYAARDPAKGDGTEDSFGLVRSDRSPKPALEAFRAMVERSAPVAPDAATP